MDNQYDPIIRETAEAALREMEFYRELRKRRTALNLWKPKAELNEQQELAFQNSTCDPVLQQVAKTVLEDIQYSKNQRDMGRCVVYVLLLIIFTIVVISIGLIVWWEHNKPPKRKYGYDKY